MDNSEDTNLDFMQNYDAANVADTSDYSFSRNRVLRRSGPNEEGYVSSVFSPVQSSDLVYLSYHFYQATPLDRRAIRWS